MGTVITSITNDTTGLFFTTTGITMTGLLSVVGGFLTQLLGAGLGLLQALMPWIIALLIIFGIVHLIRKGFGFFHILG